MKYCAGIFVSTVMLLSVALMAGFSGQIHLIGTIGPAPATLLHEDQSNLLIVGGWDGTLRCFDPFSLLEREAYLFSDSPIIALVSSSDCQRTFVVAEDGIVGSFISGENQKIEFFYDAGSRTGTAALCEEKMILLLGNFKGEVLCLDAHSAELLWTRVIHDRAIHSLQICERTSTGYSMSYDGTLSSWHLEDGSIAWKRTVGAVRPGMMILPERGILCHTGEGRQVFFRSMLTGEVQEEVSCGHEVTVMKYVQDSDLLVLGFENGFIEFWKTEPVEKITSFKAHEERLVSLDTSPDGALLFSASSDNSIGSWDITSMEPRATNEGHRWHISAVDYNEELKILVTGSFDNTARLWDLKKKQCIGIFEHPGWAVTALAVNTSGSKIYTGDARGLIKAWNTLGGFVIAELKGHADRIQALCLDKTEKILFSASRDGTIRAWSLSEGEEMKILTRGSDAVNALVLSPDGDLLVSGNSEGEVMIWNLLDLSVEGVIGRDGSRVHSLAFNSTGDVLAIGYSDGSITLVSLPGMFVKHDIKAHESWVSDLLFCCDDDLIVTASQDGNIKVWQAGSEMNLLATVRGHPGGVRAVAYVPEYSAVVSGGGWLDSTIKIWSIK